MTSMKVHPNHAGLVCPKCAGNVMRGEEEISCLQCGHIVQYLDRPYPQSELPYAKPGQKDPKDCPEPAPPTGPKPFGLTEREAETIFSNDRKTARWLIETKWPCGPVCPYCNSRRSVQNGNDSEAGDEYAEYQCAGCRRNYNILSETPMTGSRPRPGTWLMGAHKLLSDSRLETKPKSLANRISAGEKTAIKIIEATRQAKEEGREIYGTAKNTAQGNTETTKPQSDQTLNRQVAETPRRQSGKTPDAGNTETPEKADKAAPERPDAGSAQALQRNRKTPEGGTNAARTKTNAGKERSHDGQEPPPDADRRPAENTDEATGRNPMAAEDGPENERNHPTPETTPGTCRETGWTLQECRADLVRQRNELIRRRDELEARIKEQDIRIKRLDEVTNIIEEWKSTRE